MDAARTAPGSTTLRLPMTNADSPPWTQRWKSAARRAFDERPGAGAADELPVLDHEPAARQDDVGGAGHLTPFVRVVVDIHMQRFRRQRDGAVGIEDDDIGVGAWRNRALAGE